MTREAGGRWDNYAPGVTDVWDSGREVSEDKLLQGRCEARVRAGRGVKCFPKVC